MGRYIPSILLDHRIHRPSGGGNGLSTGPFGTKFRDCKEEEEDSICRTSLGVDLLWHLLVIGNGIVVIRGSVALANLPKVCNVQFQPLAESTQLMDRMAGQGNGWSL